MKVEIEQAKKTKQAIEAQIERATNSL